MDYEEVLSQNSHTESVSEPVASLRERAQHSRPNYLSKAEKRKWAEEFVTAHFSSDFVEELRQEDYLIHSSVANDDSEFDNLSQMFADAEASGFYEDDEARQIMSVWRNAD